MIFLLFIIVMLGCLAALCLGIAYFAYTQTKLSLLRCLCLGQLGFGLLSLLGGIQSWPITFGLMLLSGATFWLNQSGAEVGYDGQS